MGHRFPFLLRDRDSSYGPVFSRRVGVMGITEVITAVRSPWQNPYVERVIESIRRECLDHLIVFNERHLLRVLSSYVDYYHHSRTHLSLDKDCPYPRDVQPPRRGRVIALPKVGGLHHRYERLAACADRTHRLPYSSHLLAMRRRHERLRTIRSKSHALTSICSLELICRGAGGFLNLVWLEFSVRTRQLDRGQHHILAAPQKRTSLFYWWSRAENDAQVWSPGNGFTGPCLPAWLLLF